MNQKTWNTILIVTTVAYCIYVALVYPFLPNDLPMQFSLSGEVNWALPKMVGILMFLAVPLILNIMTLKKKEKEMSSIVTSFLIMAILIGFLTYTAFIM